MRARSLKLWTALLLLALASRAWAQSSDTAVAKAQTSAMPDPRKFTCNLLLAGQPESSVCTHQFVNGTIFKTISVNGMVITAGITYSPKYTRASVRVVNNTSAPVDVIPEGFALEESTPRSKALHFVPAEKVAASAEKQTGRTNTSRKILGGFANVASALAGSSQQTSTTQTTSSGTVSAHSSDGTYATGTYNGTSTSTTSSPDPAAQQRASEQIRQRNESIAAANAQRSAVASAESGLTMQTALSANTIPPNGAIAGFVYFEGDKKADIVVLRIPIAGNLYEFKFE